MKPRNACLFRSHASITAAFSVALISHFAAPSASAATGTWTGISGNWSDTTTPLGVWTGGIPADGAGFNANFTGADIAATQTITLDSVRTIGNISFNDATTASNNLVISGAFPLTLDVATGVPLITVSNQKLTISSEIQGTEGLTKTGAGDLELGGANTSFSGPVSVTGGTLSLTNTSALGTASGITLANATSLRLDGSPAGTFTYNYPVAVTSGTATIKNFQGIANTFNLGGSLTGPGGLAFLNDSNGNVNLTFVLQQANTYRGNTSITAIAGGNSTIKLGVADALPTTTTLTINQGAGNNGTSTGRSSSLDLAGFNQTVAGLASSDINQFENSLIRNTGGAATLTINNNSGTGRTFVGKIQGTVNVVKTGGSAQVLAANNSYAGTTTVNAGPLTLDFSQFGSSRTDTPTNYINAASVLELGGGTFTVIGRPNGSAAASTAWTGGTSNPVITFTAIPTGLVVGQAITAGTAISGAGTTAYVVGIDVANNRLSLNTHPSAASGTFATAATTVTTSQTFASTTLNSGRSGLTINANNGNGTLLAINALTRNVGGTVNFTQPAGTISATNGFTTSTANTAGTILGGWATVGAADWATNNGTNVAALGAYTLTSVAGTTAASYNGADIDVDSSAGLLDGVITPNSLRFNAAAANTVTLAAGNNTITSGGILVSANVGANASIITGGTLRGASGSDLVVSQFNTTSLTIESVIDDNTTATALTKSGSGALVLAGANLYTGPTYLNEGNLVVSAANNLGAAASNLVFNGGTLQITGTTLTSLSSLGRTVSVTPGKAVGLSIADVTNTFTVDQVLNQSTGGFTKGGVGTVIINQANTYTGTTNIFNGKAVLSGAGNLGAGANLTLSGGQLDLGGSSQTVGAVSITAAAASGDTILNGSLTGSSYAASNTTGNAIISANLLANGAIGFTKSGAGGTTTLSGTNTYTGTTAVSGGVLKISGASALGGGNLTLSGGGVLGLTANFTRAEGGGVNQFQWAGSGGFAAYGADRTVTAGTLSWGSTSLAGNSLVLGAADADATIIWASNISLAGGSRTIQANDGSDTIDAIMSGQILNSAGNLAKTGTGTLAVKTTSLYTGTTTVSAGTLMLGDGTGNTGNLSTTSSVSVSSGATLAVNRTGAFTQATDINSKIISGAGSFLQAGSGTTTLSLVNTYSGATTINAGTLALGANDVLPNTATSTVSIGNATLNAATFTDTLGTLDVTSTAKINLGTGAALAFAAGSPAWTGTLAITGTFVSGASLRFGSDNTGLSPAQLALISSPGFTGFGLNASGFLTASAAGGYSSWAATNASSTTPEQDQDGDGVSNAVEYVIGGKVITNDLSKLPAVSTSGGNVLFTFQRDQASIDGSTVVTIQVGTTLVTWPDSYNVPGPAQAVVPGVTIVKDTSPGFDTITLSIPRTPDPAKFARLNVVVTP